MNIKRFAMRAVYTTLIAGGLTLLGAGVANAAETSGDDGILSGTQAGLGIELPITIGGNAISVLGDSASSGSTTEVGEAPVAPAVTETPAAAPAAPVEPAAPVTSGDESVGGGTQALIDVAVPITIGGNAISVIGDSSTSDAAAEVASGSADAGSTPSDAASAGATTSGDDGILSGTQALIGVEVPVTVGGNAVSVLGDSSSSGAETVVGSGAGGDEAVSGDASGIGGAVAETSGVGSILGGTQLLPSLALPVTVGGNAISVVGDSSTEGPTTVVNPPVVPTEPTDPTDPGHPTDPGDPSDPSDPSDPTVPTTPADPGGSSTPAGGSGDAVASSPASTTASTSGGVTQLASTGFESNGTWWALLLLLLGIALLAERSTLPRRRSRR